MGLLCLALAIIRLFPWMLDVVVVHVSLPSLGLPALSPGLGFVLAWPAPIGCSRHARVPPDSSHPLHSLPHLLPLAALLPLSSPLPSRNPPPSRLPWPSPASPSPTLASPRHPFPFPPQAAHPLFPGPLTPTSLPSPPVASSVFALCTGSHRRLEEDAGEDTGCVFSSLQVSRFQSCLSLPGPCIHGACRACPSRAPTPGSFAAARASDGIIHPGGERGAGTGEPCRKHTGKAE